MNEAAAAAWREGSACVVQAKFAEAAEWFRKAAELEPASYEIWGDLAASEHQLGRITAAAGVITVSLGNTPPACTMAMPRRAIAPLA